MSTQNLRNFQLNNVITTVLSAIPGSARIPLPSAASPDVMVVNGGAVTVYVRTGDSTVKADVNAMPVLPGEKGVYSKGSMQPPVTHIAAWVPADTSDVVVVQGKGA